MYTLKQWEEHARRVGEKQSRTRTLRCAHSVVPADSLSEVVKAQNPSEARAMSPSPSRRRVAGGVLRAGAGLDPAMPPHAGTTATRRHARAGSETQPPLASRFRRRERRTGLGGRRRRRRRRAG